MNRDPLNQISSSLSALQSGDYTTAYSWPTGITSDFRSYDPSNSKYTSVATTRASVIDPQRSFSNISGTGRYSSAYYWYANSSQLATANANQISYLAPSASRPTNYYWAQSYTYADSTKSAFANQTIDGLNFFRLSDGNKVVMDSLKSTNNHWLWYNHTSRDNNLLTISNAGAVSKIEQATYYQDNTANPATPLLFQAHGGMPQDATTTWRTDYARDSWTQANDRETYIIYRPNFGSNVQLPTNVETLGEWPSNYDGGRSGS